MGLHLPGARFVNPGTPLREALTRGRRRARGRDDRARAASYTPDRRDRRREGDRQRPASALLATGGSTNHTHAPGRDRPRPPGITLTWDDLSDLSAVVPLLARIYPNGKADVNHFHAAGGHRVPRSHTLLERGPAARRRAHRRRATACGATRTEAAARRRPR